MSHSFNDVDCFDWFTQLGNMESCSVWVRSLMKLLSACSAPWFDLPKISSSSQRLHFFFFQKTTNLVVQSDLYVAYFHVLSSPTWRRFLWARTFLKMWLDGASSLVIGNGDGWWKLCFSIWFRGYCEMIACYTQVLGVFMSNVQQKMANIKVYGRSM